MNTTVPAATLRGLAGELTQRAGEYLQEREGIDHRSRVRTDRERREHLLGRAQALRDTADTLLALLDACGA